VRVFIAAVLATVVAASIAGSASAKGFTRVVLVGARGHSFQATARESVIDGLLGRRGASERIRSGYVRLFFVGPGGFPASPARYYPSQRCVALDWPSYETTCARVSGELVRLLAPAGGLEWFHARPTVLAHIHYLGRLRGSITTAAALESPVELALDRPGRTVTRPGGCYSFTGRWRGSRAAFRPRRFELCARGVYAGGRLHPLQRGVWAWFRLNAD